jgi:hypothetical protein
MRAVWAQRQEELSHSTRFSGKEYHCSSPASRREDLQGEAPVACRDGASVDFHPTLASVRGAALLGPQVVEVRQPRAPPLGAPLGVLDALPRQPLPFAGVRGLLPQGAGDGPRRGGAHRRPPRRFLLHPAPPPRAMGWPSRGRDGGRRRAPGPSVRLLLVVLSKPSLRMPRTRYDGSCWRAAWGHAAVLAAVVAPRGPRTRPQTLVGQATWSVRHRWCGAAARQYPGSGQPTPGEHRHPTVGAARPAETREGQRRAGRERPAPPAKRRPPWGAPRASRATSGRR